MRIEDTMKQWVDFRYERNAPMDHPPVGEIKIEEIENGIKLQKVPMYPNSTSRDLDGVVRIEATLSHEAYALMQEAGYTGEKFVFDLGKAPEKYKNEATLPPVEYKWDTAKNMLDSIFDYYYRGMNDIGGYKKIEITLLAPTGPMPQAPKPPVSGPKKNALEVGMVFDLTKGPIYYNKTQDYEVEIYKNANYNHNGHPSYIEGAYLSSNSSEYKKYYVTDTLPYGKYDYAHDFLDIDITLAKKYAAELASGDQRADSELRGLANALAARGLEFFGGYWDGLEEGVTLDTNENFLGWVTQHYSNEQISSTQAQIYSSLTAYAEQIKNGNSNINDVKGKISFDDLELTLGELVKTQSALSDIVKNTDNSSFDVTYFASAGMAVSSVKNFAENNLPQDTAKKVSALFETRVTEAIDRRFDPNDRDFKAIHEAIAQRQASRSKGTRDIADDPQFAKVSTEMTGYFFTNAYDLEGDSLNAKTYRLFSGISGSNKSEISQSFDKARQWVVGEFGKWYDAMGHTSEVRDRNAIAFEAELIKNFGKLF